MLMMVQKNFYHSQANMNKQVGISERLVDGALDVLFKEGDFDKYNEMMMQAIEKFAAPNDIVVLAHGSIIVLLPNLVHSKTSVLAIPRIGVETEGKYLAL
jgi:hypothetical protein